MQKGKSIWLFFLVKGFWQKDKGLAGTWNIIGLYLYIHTSLIYVG